MHYFNTYRQEYTSNLYHLTKFLYEELMEKNIDENRSLANCLSMISKSTTPYKMNGVKMKRNYFSYSLKIEKKIPMAEGR